MKSVMTRETRSELITAIFSRGTAFLQDIREIPFGKSRISLELQDVSPQIILDTLFVGDAIVYQQKIIHAIEDVRELLNYFIGKEIMYQGDDQLEQQKHEIASCKY